MNHDDQTTKPFPAKDSGSMEWSSFPRRLRLSAWAMPRLIDESVGSLGGEKIVFCEFNLGQNLARKKS